MKKRIYALALCLLLLTAFPLTAFADGEGAQTAPELTIATEREGETLTVTVGVVNNPGIAGVDFALHFNSAALTPSAAPEMTENWTVTTSYTEAFSGDTLKVVGVREENVTGDELFTATFTVEREGSYALSVDGVACAAESEELIELPTVFADDFGVGSVSRDGNSVTATVVSYGSGYSGEAKAILTCYQGGKFVGCVMQTADIAENAATNVKFDNISLSGDTLRLLLTDANFVPLTEPVVLPAGK